MADWAQLKEAVGGRLLALHSPFEAGNHQSAACQEALAQIKNPYYLGDQPALTQTSGWVDAWTSHPSVYAVAAENTQDVVSAVNFARQHHLRLVVKGGGHSYQGTSSAPDSLLIWTRHMNAVTLHDAFVPQGCAGDQAPVPAVTVQAGAMWMDAYSAVTTRGGRYVQGGGCTTVGVAGLVQSGGFGHFSKRFGTASGNLLQAEIVTADGKVHVVNACQDPELFWAIKGGGGGSLGVITQLTLRTYDLPDTFGAVLGVIKADSAEAWRALIAFTLRFYRDALFNPHWGEQMQLGSNHTLKLAMMFQGLSQLQAEEIWAPYLAAVREHPEWHILEDVQIVALPARHFWDADFHRVYAPQASMPDQREGASSERIFWPGDAGQVGQFIHGARSGWLPQSLLGEGQIEQLSQAIFDASQHWSLSLHFNKGLAGGLPDAIERSRDTAMNPGALDAFALVMNGGESGPAFPDMLGVTPDLATARSEKARIDRCMDVLLAVAPGAGSYVSESDYFERDWQTSFWGNNYPRLAAAKRRYDPEGLFFVRHGVGSEGWRDDGFSRQAQNGE